MHFKHLGAVPYFCMKFAHDCLEFVQSLGCTEIVQSGLLRKLSVYSVCLCRSLIEFVFGTEKPPFTESAVVAPPFPFRLASGLGSPIGKALSLEIRLKGWGQNRTSGGPAECLACGVISITLSPALAGPSFGLALLVSKGGWHRMRGGWWFFRVGCAGRGMASFGVLVWIGCRVLVFTSRRALASRQAGGSIESPQRPVARSPHDSTASLLSASNAILAPKSLDTRDGDGQLVSSLIEGRAG